MEEWKEIIGYEGAYMVSNYGRIKSLGRSIIGKNGYKRLQPEKILKPYLGKRGYLVVNLNKNSVLTAARTIHQLVWDHFGNTPRNGYKQLVDHIDENKLNNHYDNLQLLTNRQNIVKSRMLCPKSSIYIGTSKIGNKWKASIRVKGKSIYLGRFNTGLEAHQAYLNALEVINICESKNYVIPNLKKQIKKTHEQEVCKVVSWTEIKC